MTRPYPAPARAGGRWAALLLAGLLACGPDKPSEPPRPPVKPDPRPLVDEAELPEAVQTGKGLYDKYCALCHGEAGVGYAADHANALANDTFLATADNGFLWAAIDRGRPGTPMAAYGARFGGPLSNDDIRHLLVYLRSLDRDDRSIASSPLALTSLRAHLALSILLV